MRKHLAVVALVLAVAACGGVNHTTFEPVYRSAKAVEVGTASGITFAAFTALLQQFTTEVAIARDKAANTAEHAMVDRYAVALPIYHDSAALWALKIHDGAFLADEGAAKVLATKHGLMRESTGAIDAEAGIQAIWARAAVWVAAGNAAYNGVSVAH